MKTIGTKEHRALVAMIKQKRLVKNLRQSDIAKALGEQQSWVARLESGQRRIDVVEFFRVAKAIGFDPHRALKRWAHDYSNTQSRSFQIRRRRR